ncbi:MAG TPA: nitroreductase family deazaflavin-dependent oxidoreductase [Blastocatellia bacterium]|nr:nitroreductase family deazaflavin-dependent oxidoreductase [Blastocatellia bacterium]
MDATNAEETVGRRPSKLSAALQNCLTSLHTFVYANTNGAIGGRMMNSPVLLLTTRGRKTNKLRTVPLLYLADGNDVVLVASNGGATRHPTWWLNLQANPDARIQVRETKQRVRAERASAEEKRRLWPSLVAMYPGYEKYQEITNRDIPVVILHPNNESNGSHGWTEPR